MSQYAFTDEAIRQRLAAKGDRSRRNQAAKWCWKRQHCTCKPGWLICPTVQGPACDGFFDRLTLELVVWPKT
jgi:hypothetical protein